MDSDSLLGPRVDLTKVEALQHKRTIAFINHFVTHTAGFLNRFSSVCEEKLENLSVRMQRLETTMNILEGKLASIPGLNDITAPVSQQPQPVQQQQQQQPQPPSDTQFNHVNGTTPAVVQNGDVTVEPEVPEVVGIKVSQDPRYAKYFRMLQVGVPANAFRQKMLMEGLDPSLIDTPNATISTTGAAAALPPPPATQQSDSDADFSDDEHSTSSDDDSSPTFSD